MLRERRIPRTALRWQAQTGAVLATGCGRPTPTLGSMEGLNGSDGRCLSCLWDFDLLPNYWEIGFITILTLFLTLFFSRLHFHSLINFCIFLTVYNPCHGCHGNRRECAQR